MPRSSAIGGQLELFPELVCEPPPRPKPVRRARPVEPAVAPEWNELATRLPGTLRLGTSSWSFPGWEGLVYAHKHTQKELTRQGLAAYAQHPLLATVGLDRTYYGPLPTEELAALAEAVSERFKFVVKAHELCTMARFPRHRRYGSKGGELNALFLDAAYASEMVVAPLVEGLKDRLGPVLFQFPPQDVEAMGGPHGFAQALHNFLDALPSGPRYAVELRNGSLLTPFYRAVMERLDAVHCVNVHPTMPPPGLQAQRMGVLEGPLVLVRWMLGGGQQYDDAVERYKPFDRIVDEDRASRDAIAEICREAAARGKEAFVVVNNKAEGCAPLSIVELARSVAREEPLADR